MKFIILTLVPFLFVYSMELEDTEIGLKISSLNYIEYNTQAVILDTETTNHSFIFGAYLLHNIKLYSDLLSLELRNNFSMGVTKYTGSLLSGGSFGDVVSTTTNIFQNSESNLFIHAFSNDKIEVSLLFGLGYHYWERTLSVNQNEIYTWVYRSIGGRFGLTINEKKRVVLTLAGSRALNPKMYVDIPSVNLDDTFILGSTFGFMSEIKYIEKMFSDQFLSLSLSYEYLYSGRSNDIVTSQGIFTEPESTHKGLHMNIGFIFKSL